MAEPLKNQIDAEMVSRIAAQARAVDPETDVGALEHAAEQLDDLELKERMDLLADALEAALTGDRRAQLAAIATMARHLEGFAAWPLATFIERHGLDEVAASLDAMEAVTGSMSCEFAIRPFLVEHFDETIARIHSWTSSPSAHHRRLASEGTRPRLPWARRVPRLDADPHIGLSVLEALRHDPSEDVRRSVANHLNDVAKSDPELVVTTTARWAAEDATDQAMVRHALRTLVKRGDAGALAVLGFTAEPVVDGERFEVEPAEIALGEHIELVAALRSTADPEQRLVVDFVIHHVRANGSTGPKVFKWSTPTLSAGETVELRKRRMIATASTRRYHAGLHRIELQVAGTAAAEASFRLTESS